MVSTSDIIFGGLAILLLGVTFTSVSGFRRPVNLLQDTMEDPPIPQQDPQIPLLENLLSQANQLFKKTFKPPQVLDCRGPNCLGILQARGTQIAIDPFTGGRIAVGGTPQALPFFGGKQQVVSNIQRVVQGRAIQSQLSDFIMDLQNQLKILRTPDIVNV